MALAAAVSDQRAAGPVRPLRPAGPGLQRGPAGLLAARHVAAAPRRQARRRPVAAGGAGGIRPLPNPQSWGSRREVRPPSPGLPGGGLRVRAGPAGGRLWARGVIARQQRVTRALVWPPSVFQKQQTVQTCGPAALAAVCRHFGIAATEGEIARLAGTDARGTSMRGLQKAARAKGLAAEGVRVTPEGLSRTPLPCILFFHPGHFAVLTGIQDGRQGGREGRQYLLADPSLGQRTVTREQLAALWHGEALLVGPLSGGHASAGAP